LGLLLGRRERSELRAVGGAVRRAGQQSPQNKTATSKTDLKYSDVLGSNRQEDACRQDTTTNSHAAPLHTQLMLEAYAEKPPRKLRKLLEVYSPG
jgi:hypothetical protein